MSAKNNQSLRDQLAELDTLVSWFDQPDFDLDEAVIKFEEGMKLVEALQTRLNTLESKITVLKERFDQGEQ